MSRSLYLYTMSHTGIWGARKALKKRTLTVSRFVIITVVIGIVIVRIGRVVMVMVMVIVIVIVVVIAK